METTLVVAETVARVECFLGGKPHGRENTNTLEDVGVLHEEDIVLLHEPKKVFGCLGGLEGVFLDGVELGGEVGEQGLLPVVLDEKVVGVVASDQDVGHVACCSKGDG